MTLPVKSVEFVVTALARALAEEVRQRKLAVLPGAGIGEVSFDQRVQTKAFVQLAREQEAGIGGHRGPPELDAELGVEREANRARFRVTHWVVPSASVRSPREPRFLRVLSDYDPARSVFKSKMRVQSQDRHQASRVKRTYRAWFASEPPNVRLACAAVPVCGISRSSAHAATRRKHGEGSEEEASVRWVRHQF